MRLQDLDPASSRLCLAVEKVFHQKFSLPKGRKLLLAVSGGADSVALALVFHVLAPRLDARLVICHINHNIRPGAAEDAKFVERLCCKLAVEHVSASVNVPQFSEQRQLGLEEASRIMRLHALEQQRVATGSDYILVAHHAGDLAEDILLRLTRGAGWPALGGMRWRNGLILRPFLHTSPADLRAFLHACSQPWREDDSNSELVFKRNRFRHVFLPLFRCENPAVDAAFLKIHEFAQLDADYWEKEFERILAEHPLEPTVTETGITLSLARSMLTSLHPAVRLRLYHKALGSLRGLADVGGQTRADTLLRLDSTFQSGEGAKLFQCGGGIEASCGRQGIIFQFSKLV